MIHQLLMRDLLEQADSVKDWNLINYKTWEKDDVAGHYFQVELYHGQGKDYPMYFARKFDDLGGHELDWGYLLLSADRAPRFSLHKPKRLRQRIWMNGSEINFKNHPALVKVYSKAYLSAGRTAGYETERYLVQGSEVFDLMSRVKKWKIKETSSIENRLSGGDLMDFVTIQSVLAGKYEDLVFKARRRQVDTFNLEGEKVSRGMSSYELEVTLPFCGKEHLTEFSRLTSEIELQDRFEELYVEWKDGAEMPEEEEQPEEPKARLADPWKVRIPTIGEGLR